MTSPGQPQFSIRQLVGVSLLSGAGSVPYQILPLIVAVLVDQSRASVAEAGAVGSAIVLGQLVAAIGLAKLSTLAARPWFATASGFFLMTGLFFTAINTIIALLFGWFIVGLSGGALRYFGTTTAGQHELRRFAFALRLGVASLLTGIASLLLLSGAAVHNYNKFTIILTSFFVGTLLLGNLCLRVNASHHHVTAIASGVWKVGDVVGLAVVYTLFIGQAGFGTYVLQQAASRGLSLGNAVWALTDVKLISGAMLLLLARRELTSRRRLGFAVPGCCLAGSIFTLSWTTNPVLFFGGLLVFTTTLNALSSNLQAKVAAVSPRVGLRWLPASILLGSATGPFLNGMAISSGRSSLFLVFAVSTSFLPAAWALLEAGVQPKSQQI